METINTKELNKEERLELINKLKEDGLILAKIENPTPAMAFEAVKQNKEAIHLIKDEILKTVISNPLFLNSEMDSTQFENQFLGLEWSGIQKIKISEKEFKEGKTLTSITREGEIKTNFISKFDKFDLDNDPIGKKISSSTLKNEIIQGRIIALKDRSENIRFFKKDEDLNRIVSVPRMQVNIPKQIGEYKLSTVDINDLLLGKTLTGIPFENNGQKAVISISYNQENNKLRPEFTQSLENNQEFRKNQAVKTMKTISEKEELKFTGKDETKFKEMISLLDNGEVDKFSKIAEKYKIPKSFVSQNIINNKNLSEDQKVKAMLNGAKLSFKEVTEIIKKNNSKHLNKTGAEEETNKLKQQKKDLSNSKSQGVSKIKEGIKGLTDFR